MRRQRGAVGISRNAEETPDDPDTHPTLHGRRQNWKVNDVDERITNDVADSTFDWMVRIAMALATHYHNSVPEGSPS
jgi:hypothetical protein